MGEPASDATRPKPGPAPKRERVECVIIRPLPKAVVLYPTAILCLVFGLIGLFFDVGRAPHWMGLTFLFVFGFNLFVMNFEFSRGTAFTLFAAAVAILFAGLFFGERLQIPVFASMAGWVRGLNIQVNAGFYLAMGAILGVTFLIVASARLVPGSPGQAYLGERGSKEKIRELKKRLKRVEQERDLLKKAAAYFANEEG